MVAENTGVPVRLIRVATGENAERAWRRE